MTGTLKVKVDGVWIPIAGADQPEAQWNSAWGVVAMQTYTGSTGGTTTESLIGSPASFTARAGRRYRVHGQALLSCDVVGTPIGLRLKRSGSAVQRKQVSSAVAGHGQGCDVEHFIDGTGTSESWTLHVAREAGSGSVVAYGDSTCSSWLIVEDVGPSSPSTALGEGPAPAGCIRNNPPSSIPAGAYTAIAWSATAAAKNITVTNTTTLTIQAPGVYAVSLSMSSAAQTNAGAYVSLMLGTTRYDFPLIGNGNVAATATRTMAAGETIIVNYWNPATGAQTWSSGQLDVWKVT